jgi:hypothetical protein
MYVVVSSGVAVGSSQSVHDNPVGGDQLQSMVPVVGVPVAKMSTDSPSSIYAEEGVASTSRLPERFTVNEADPEQPLTSVAVTP